MKDLRNRSITIKVNEDEYGMDSIARYLKSKKFIYKEIRTAGTILENWSNEEYYNIFVTHTNYNEETKKITFILDGER